MPFPFQEALSVSDHLLAGGFAFLFAVAGALVCGGSVFTLLAKSRASDSMDPRWDDLALLCARTTRALAAWAVCPLGLGLWVVMMAQRPRMMEQLHSIFLAPALLGLLLFALGLCFSGRYIGSLDRSSHERRSCLAWGFLSATGFWCAAAVLVSVCAFSLHTGAWVAQPGLWNALWNPVFPAALSMWAAVSVSTFGAAGLLYAATRKDGAWRVALAHELGKWLVAGAVIGVLGWIWWGISLPEGEDRQLVIGLIAAAVAAQAILGNLAYRWGVREPEKRRRRHAYAVSVLVVFLTAVHGWAYMEAKGNFQIHQYMYRNGIIIEEAENVNQTSLWKFVNLGEPLPAQEELGAFNFRAQCMACHAGWVKPQDPARFPRFRFKGDALRFLGEMRSKHPPYPLFAGVPEERRALAAYLEELITKSGRTLVSRPEPPPAGEKTVVHPAMVSKTSPEEAEKRSENVSVSKPEAVEQDEAVFVLPPPDAAQGPEREKEAKAPEKKDRPIGSLPPPATPEDAEKPQEQADSAVSSARPSDAQDGRITKNEEAVSMVPPDEKKDASNPTAVGMIEDEKAVAPLASSSNARGGKFSESENNIAIAPSVPSGDAPSARKPESGEDISTASPNPPTAEADAEKSRKVELPENLKRGGSPSPVLPGNLVYTNSPAEEESASAAPSGPVDDSRNAKKPEGKNTP